MSIALAAFVGMCVGVAIMQFKKLIKVDTRGGFDQYAMEDQVEIFISQDGVARLISPWGNHGEILLTPSQCREALFEERDLWN